MRSLRLITIALITLFLVISVAFDATSTRSELFPGLWLLSGRATATNHPQSEINRGLRERNVFLFASEEMDDSDEEEMDDSTDTLSAPKCELSQPNVKDSFHPPCGQLTFDAEGQECPDEKKKCHQFYSRKPHVPTGDSGVTIGRGYDLKLRNPVDIKRDLMCAGLKEEEAEAYSKAGCKKENGRCKAQYVGDDARKFIKDHQKELVEITPEQQLRLFEIAYSEAEKQVERISAKKDTEKKYGKVDFCKLNPKIKDILVDLKFRGDYTPKARIKIQKLVARNDFNAFKKTMEDENYWERVPDERFNQRVDFLNDPSKTSQCNRSDSQCDSPCNQPNGQSKSNTKQESEVCLATAHSANDPHLVTFDGMKYDLQTLGEFILIKSNRSDFEVQARQTPYNNSGSLAINSAVAVKAGSDRVAIYAQSLPDGDTSTPLRVNGKPVTIQGNKLALKGGGEILKQGSTYVVSAPTGEKVLVNPSSSFLNISPVVDNRSGKYSGLLGNVNGNPNDDLQIRGGGSVLEVRSTYGDVNKVLKLVGLRAPGVLDRAEQVYFDQLYKQFANSWRVKQEESLFDYPAGKTTKSYVNPGFPDKYLTLNMLSADQIQKARNACTEAKVTQDLMEGCIFDVGFSGFSEFARTTAEITGYVKIVNQLFPGSNIPTPEQTVNRVREKVKPRICLPFAGCH